jgi:hypothetical protein
MRTGYGGAVILLVLFLILSWCPALALGDEPEPPPIEEPKAMTLTANPTSIYLGSDTSIITAAVYNDTNCTEPKHGGLVQHEPRQHYESDSPGS